MLRSDDDTVHQKSVCLQLLLLLLLLENTTIHTIIQHNERKLRRSSSRSQKLISLLLDLRRAQSRYRRELLLLLLLLCLMLLGHLSTGRVHLTRRVVLAVACSRGRRNRKRWNEMAEAAQLAAETPTDPVVTAGNVRNDRRVLTVAGAVATIHSSVASANKTVHVHCVGGKSTTSEVENVWRGRA